MPIKGASGRTGKCGHGRQLAAGMCPPECRGASHICRGSAHHEFTPEQMMGLERGAPFVAGVGTLVCKHEGCHATVEAVATTANTSLKTGPVAPWGIQPNGGDLLERLPDDVEGIVL